MHKHLLPLASLTLLLASCGLPQPQSPSATDPTQLLGRLELPISTQPGLSGQALTLREGNVSVTQTGVATVQTAGGYDYMGVF